MTPTSPDPAKPWADRAAAAAYMARLQKLLDVKGLDGTEPKVKPLMRRAVVAFQARDFAVLATACDELVDVIEAHPTCLAK